jgi:hypothetical protein
LYLGSDERTCFLELEQPGCGICIAEVIVDRALKILDFQEIDRFSDREEDRLMRMLVMSSLLSSPRVQSGWSRPEYVFTRFVADCARSAGFQAITYPSCRTVEGHNLVVLNAREEDWPSLIRVSSIRDYKPDDPSRKALATNRRNIPDLIESLRSSLT